MNRFIKPVCRITITLRPASLAAMVLSGVLVLALVGCATCTPYGYGVKSGAAAKGRKKLLIVFNIFIKEILKSEKKQELRMIK